MAVEILNMNARRITIPDPLPAGNLVAHQIRLIHDNSENLLPASAGSQRSYEKYPSVSHADFRGDTEYILPDGIPEYNVVPFQKKRDTVANILFSYRKNQMFTAWSIPNRFVSEHPDAYDAPLHLKSTEEAIDDTKLDQELEDKLQITPPVPPSPPCSAKAASRAESAISLQAPPQMVDRQMSKTLPEIEMRKHSRDQSRELSRQYTRLPDMMRTGSAQQSKAVPQIPVSRAGSAACQPQVRVQNEEKSENALRQEIEHSFQPHAVDRAEQWMRRAPSTDRRVIEKVLRLTEKKQRIDNSLNKTLQPDAKATVESWLTNANEPERQVALKFFNSIAGQQLMGASMNEQKRRLQAVVDALESGKGQSYSPKPSSASKGRLLGESKGQSRLKHIRLLSPGTRKNKWMYSTWHHLPEYKDPNIVGNWSSHYIKPHEHTPRHFVIHPDWG